jgi:3-deoxy-D-manno-octulosonate 8-phosphate phosphatase (KDO 8-P phosphatase)
VVTRRATVRTLVRAAKPARLSTRELGARARRIALVISDVDGVLTDAGVYYSQNGEELKRFNVRDGMGVERLRNVGIATAFLTRERSASVAARAEKLRLPYVYLGVEDKAKHLEVILQDTGLTVGEVAYIGDDTNDLGILESIGKFGLTAAPADAIPAIKHVATLRCAAKGGQGAFREFAEWILQHRSHGG